MEKRRGDSGHTYVAVYATGEKRGSGGGGETYVVLLWVCTGEGKRPHNDPLLLLKGFHKQYPTLLSPAGERWKEEETRK